MTWVIDEHGARPLLRPLNWALVEDLQDAGALRELVVHPSGSACRDEKCSNEGPTAPHKETQCGG